MLVYDVEPEGSARLITRGATRLAGDGEVAFDLYPQDWQISADHHVGTFISGSDDDWFDPGLTGSTADVKNGSLSIPFLRFDRDFEPELAGEEGGDMASSPRRRSRRRRCTRTSSAARCRRGWCAVPAAGALRIVAPPRATLAAP